MVGEWLESAGVEDYFISFQVWIVGPELLKARPMKYFRMSLTGSGLNHNLRTVAVELLNIVFQRGTDSCNRVTGVKR